MEAVENEKKTMTAAYRKSLKRQGQREEDPYFHKKEKE